MIPRIAATISWGRHAGLELSPHRMKDGGYIVSPTRWKKDYIRVETLEQVVAHVRRGYSLRMSARSPRTAPSLISPSSLRIEHVA